MIKYLAKFMEKFSENGRRSDQHINAKELGMQHCNGVLICRCSDMQIASCGYGTLRPSEVPWNEEGGRIGRH